MLHKIKYFSLNIFERIKIFRLEQKEKKKINDKRRKKIYTKVELTSLQKKSIDDVYINNYGKKISNVWHRYFTAYTGKFDKNFFPEILYIPNFENYMNNNKNYCKVYEDKSILPLLASNIGVKTPKAYVTCSYNLYRNCKNEKITKEEALDLLKNIGPCFAKPTIDSDSGRGCILLNLKNGIDKNSNSSLINIFEELGENFVVQEVIKCHSSLSKIYSKSVNTFRIMTYRWNDEILTTPSILRLGRNNNYLDNAHAGGIFIGIDNDGLLNDVAFTEFNQKFYFHPDTKVKFIDYKIDLFPKVLNIAKKMHALMPQVGVINWDFTIDEVGDPILIESNILGGGIWLFQMAHGKGPFGDKTEEILRWVKIMKKTSIEKYYNYKFGDLSHYKSKK